MKILGVKNNEVFLASVSHYDFRREGDLLADGGIVGLQHYAGYSRFSGERVWAEVPQTFSELIHDYEFSAPDKRKYGKWKLEEVRILPEDEWPDTDSFEWKVENAIWGHRGKDGKDKLQYSLMTDLNSDHLKAILETQNISEEKRKIIAHILKSRGE